MTNSRSERVEAEYLEYEFIPPLNLPESWSMSWDRQIEAALAWQAALEMESFDRADEKATRTKPTMRTLTRMTTLLESVRERLLQIQSESANVAIAEMGLRQLPSSGEGTNDAFTPLHAEHAQRFDVLARSAFDIATMAQAEIARLVGLVSGTTSKYADRRQRAALIDFPDRRKAA